MNLELKISVPCSREGCEEFFEVPLNFEIIRACNEGKLCDVLREAMHDWMSDNDDWGWEIDLSGNPTCSPHCRGE